MEQIKHIYSLFQECKCISTDSRNLVTGSIFFALRGDNFDGNLFALYALENGCTYSIVDDFSISKSSPNIIFVENVLVCLQELAAYHRVQLGIPIIAITGTNGKTTTKELLSTVLSKKYNVLSTKGNFNNHLGVPLTLLSITAEHNFAVVEMGASHVGEIKELCEIAKPNYGLITNIGKAHLEGFGSFEGVINAKKELYDYIIEHNGILFQNGDNNILNNLLADYSSIKYGKQDSYFCFGDVFENNPFLEIVYIVNSSTHEDVVEENHLKSNLIGAYNFENIMAAVCVASYFDISNSEISDSIENYFPTNNRSQFIKTENNSIILDAYNANPSSMKEAITNFKTINTESKVLILGDMLELGAYSAEEHKNIINLVNELKFDSVYYVGKEFSKLLSKNVFQNIEELQTFMKNNEILNSSILVKGSRGIKLEKIIGSIR